MILEEFIALRYRLIDHIANFHDLLHGRPVTPAESPVTIREVLQAERPLPKDGKESAFLLDRSATLHRNRSLSSTVILAFGDISSLRPRPSAPWAICWRPRSIRMWPRGLWAIAGEIEGQTIRWIAEMIGDQTDCGGLFVGSGSLANLLCFLAARQAKRGWDPRICIIPFLCLRSPRCS